MSRLVSKWADDDSLVAQADRQDHQHDNSRATSSSSAKQGVKPPKSEPKSTKLESMWADAPDDDTEVKPKKSHRSRKSKSYMITPPSSRDNDRPPGNDDNDNNDEPLPPMTEGAKALAARIGNVNVPKGPKASQHKSANTQKSHIQHEPSEPLPPMTKGAKSLADRIGSSHGNRHSGYHRHGRRDRQHSPEPEQQWQQEDADEEEIDEEDLPPMTEGAKSLAARLGMLDVSASNPPTRSSTKKSSKRSVTSSTTPKQRYLTPKQKQLEQQQADIEQQLQEKQATLEADKLKVQKEIENIMKQMDDSNSSWADIE